MARGVPQCCVRGLVGRPSGTPLRSHLHPGKVVSTQGSSGARSPKDGIAFEVSGQGKKQVRRQPTHPNAPVPTGWSPAQAAAVFEMVDALRDAIWNIYGMQIQAFERADRLPTPSGRKSIDESDVPF